MIIHEKGPKAERDRRRGLEKYDQLCKFFRVKPLPAVELSKLSNTQLYRLGEDLWNRQPLKARQRYTDYVGLTVSNPLSWRRFVAAVNQLYRPKGWRKPWLWLTLPFRYPGFVRRSKASAKSKGLNVRTGEAITPA